MARCDVWRNDSEKNEIWKLADLPVGKQPVRCKWIYIVKYKAMLVVKGITQTYGIDN